MTNAQGARFFTSDLSVKEFLLTREAGFDCAGLVMGSSIYYVGYQRGSYYQNQARRVELRRIVSVNSSPREMPTAS